MPKFVNYEDTKGRLSIREIPDDKPLAHARYGVLVGPPDLSSLNLPEEVEVRLNNELFNRGLLTLSDARRRPAELEAALKAALKLDVQALMAAY